MIQKFEDLQHLLNCSTNDFNIIEVTEIRIATQVSLENNLDPNNCSY